MALPQLTGTGRLLTDPRKGVGKNDTRWCSALIRFASWRKVNDEWVEGEPTVASAIGFGDHATALAEYRKGDEVTITGHVRASVWKDQPQLAVTVTEVSTPEKTGRAATPSNGLAEARAAASSHLRQFDARRNANQETAA